MIFTKQCLFHKKQSEVQDVFQTKSLIDSSGVITYSFHSLQSFFSREKKKKLSKISFWSFPVQ